MKQFTQTLHAELENKLQLIQLEADDIIEVAELSIKVLLSIIEKLKEFTINNQFKSEAEEIYFFKCIKPRFVSNLIYYNSIYKIETKKPYGRRKTIKKHLNNELDKIKRFFCHNLEFYKYYRTNSNYLDHKYFVRGNHDIKLILDTYYFDADHSFSTSHDYKVAKIMANDLIQVYLEDQLYNVGRKNLPIIPSSLNWTGSKAALIELIYGLYVQGVFDNGSTDIKFIAKAFETAFNIDLGDFYHTYLELRSRKINRTKFLDALREGLLRKMDEQDQKRF